MTTEWRCPHGWLRGEQCKDCADLAHDKEQIKRLMAERDALAESDKRLRDEIGNLQAGLNHYRNEWSDRCNDNQGLINERDAANAALATAIVVGHKALAERDIWEQSCDEQITLLNQIANERGALKLDAARYQYIRAGNVYIETPNIERIDFYAVIIDASRGRYYSDMDHFDADLDDAIAALGETE